MNGMITHQGIFFIAAAPGPAVDGAGAPPLRVFSFGSDWRR
jgi:hypothetical protein